MHQKTWLWSLSFFNIDRVVYRHYRKIQRRNEQYVTYDVWCFTERLCLATTVSHTIVIQKYSLGLEIVLGLLENCITNIYCCLLMSLNVDIAL